MNCAIVLYTHTDVKDVWPAFFGQTEKYLPDTKKYIFVDKDDEDIPEGYTKIFYDDSKVYRERFLSCMEQVDDEFVLIHHEDMFLYDTPDIDRINKYIERIKSDKTKHFVKLIRGGSQVGKDDTEHSELKVINNTFEYIFAIQPTIWKSDKLIELLSKSGGENIWKFEMAAQRTCRENKIYGFYVDDGGIKRGSLHWDSKVYPYVATAVVKGKWNTKEYKDEITKIANEYGIEIKDRGTND